MNRKKMLKVTLIACFALLSIGGWLLHLRVHPPAQNGANFIPFLSGIAGVVVLPLMFWFRSTFAYAYVLNGFFVIIGTITMAHFSVVHFKGPLTLAGIFMNTTAADIALLWGKFAVGKGLFELESLRSDSDEMPRGRFFRYPNMGWWWVHLFLLAIVYALGNLYWR
jgi:hypothetical protein